MKRSRIILLLLLGIGITKTGHTQQRGPYRHLLRAYDDNDIINIPGEGTDRGYSNGTRLDYFLVSNKQTLFFLNRIMPKAGDSSVNTFGFSLMQVIYTPKNILKRIPDRNDFAYAGGLFATHSLLSANPIKKYSWQTEVLLGVMGPPSLAKDAQLKAHRIVNIVKPGGWDYQLKTDLLLNVSVAGEKELLHIGHFMEAIGGAQAFAGTAMNGLSLYSLFRIGKMTPYFNGYISQFSTPRREKSRWQVYAIVRPAVECMLSYALIDGGVFNRNNEPVPVPDPDYDEPVVGDRVRNRVVGKLGYGLVVSAGRVGISFTQTTMTPVVKGTGRQEIGNISLHLAW
jgi:lipid A 3-O-deacylase